MKKLPHCVILHPGLGYGGAERLILQLAEGLTENGWRCTLIVPEKPHRDGFEVPASVELFLARVHMPLSIFGRLKAWCAYFRMRICITAVQALQADLIVTDLVPHVIPAIKARFPGTPVLNYCHFPDHLLAAPVKSAWYQTYRKYFDRLELQGLLMADRIVVNSGFTQRKLLVVYPQLEPCEIVVVHPGIKDSRCSKPAYHLADKPRVLSLGRIHPSKNHRLSVESFALANIPEWVKLTICGGYDETDLSCREESHRLRTLVGKVGLENRVEWHFNPSDMMLETLWDQSAVLLYPPPEEHFGLVPLEAMVRGVPVIAVDAGGPSEIIACNKTGLLVPADAGDFARALQLLFAAPEKAARFSEAGYERAISVFPMTAFNTKVAAHAASLIRKKRHVVEHN
jgi:alpha-1,3/alpha-1,6-mannosyltransferase